MRRLVVDGPTVMSWFDPDGAGAAMRRDYEAGAFAAVAPRRLLADLLAAASTRGLDVRSLEQLAAELPRIGIGLQDPPLGQVATWIGRGLAPEVAPYAALAETLDVPLAAGDERLRAGAGPLLQR